MSPCNTPGTCRYAGPLLHLLSHTALRCFAVCCRPYMTCVEYPPYPGCLRQIVRLLRATFSVGRDGLGAIRLFLLL